MWCAHVWLACVGALLPCAHDGQDAAARIIKRVRSQQRTLLSGLLYSIMTRLAYRLGCAPLPGHPRNGAFLARFRLRFLAPEH